MDNTQSNVQRETVSAANTNQITKGMDVYGSSGNKLGSISGVQTNAGSPAATGAATTSVPGSAATGSMQRETGAAGGQTGYFEVKGSGALNMGVINAKDLYIPFSAVQSVDTNNNKVVLNCTQQEADQRFQNKPSGWQ